VLAGGKPCLVHASRYSSIDLNRIRKLASHSLDYSLSNALPREKESFGLEQGGRIMLLNADQLPQLVLNLAATFPQSSP
jgi:protein BCP1